MVMGTTKLGKLAPGDTLSVMIFKQPESIYDHSMGLTLNVAVLDDGKIQLPLLERVPAAGLSILELKTAVQQRYADCFSRPNGPNTAPPRVTIQFVGHLGKTASDRLIERLRKPSTTR
jgi:protein involved in polysaccharide export with SLBB domain